MAYKNENRYLMGGNLRTLSVLSLSCAVLCLLIVSWLVRLASSAEFAFAEPGGKSDRLNELPKIVGFFWMCVWYSRGVEVVSVIIACVVATKAKNNTAIFSYAIIVLSFALSWLAFSFAAFYYANQAFVWNGVG